MFKRRTAYEIGLSLVGSEKCRRDGPAKDLDVSIDVNSAAANDPLTEGQSPSKNFPILNQCIFGESFSA